MTVIERFRPSSLSKVFALTLPWCMGLTRREASHHPKLPPRACFGTRPLRRMSSAGACLQHQPNSLPRACFGTRPGAVPAFVIAQSFRFNLTMVHGIDAAGGFASSKPAAACLLWYTTVAVYAFSIIQTLFRELAFDMHSVVPGLQHRRVFTLAAALF